MIQLFQTPDERWYERVSKLGPANLHEAQLARCLSGAGFGGAGGGSAGGATAAGDASAADSGAAEGPGAAASAAKAGGCGCSTNGQPGSGTCIAVLAVLGLCFRRRQRQH